jgi:hypothetical protein
LSLNSRDATIATVRERTARRTFSASATSVDAEPAYESDGDSAPPDCWSFVPSSGS